MLNFSQAAWNETWKNDARLSGLHEQGARGGFEDGEPAVLDAYGDYGSRQVWIAADIDAEHGYTAQLERYPELSRDETCYVEMEWEQEALES